MRKGYLPMAHVGVAGDDVVVGATRLAPACMHASVCVRVHASMRVRECMVDEHKSMRLRVYVNVCMHAVVGAANVFIFHTSPFHPLLFETRASRPSAGFEVGFTCVAGSTASGSFFITSNRPYLTKIT